MNTMFSFTFKLVLKAFALIALPITVLLNAILTFCAEVLRYAALPFMAIALYTGVTTFQAAGMDPTVINCAWTFIAGLAFFVLLPMTPAALSWMKDLFVEIIQTPLIIRSPIKYVFD